MFVFTETIAIGAGAVRNATAVCRRIDLDPREADDDISEPFRMLRFQPKAVWVEPVEAPVKLGATCGTYGPPDCIPIRPKKFSGSVSFKNADVFCGGIQYRTWSGTRVAFPLAGGYCVTDYYAQGQTFGDAEWYAHLANPDRGSLRRASVLVTLTRHKNLDKLRAWAPLWTDDATTDDNGRTERDKVVDAFLSAATPEADLRADMARLMRLAASTQQQLGPRISRLLASVSAVC